MSRANKKNGYDLETLLSVLGFVFELMRTVVNALRKRGGTIDHLRRLLMSILQDEALTQGMKSVLQEKGCPHTESFYRLRSAGVILGDSGREVLPRCQLYSVYLKRHLL
jgi:hypothetical protein